MLLARRAVASPDWRWMPGMLALHFPGMARRVARIDGHVAALLYCGDAVPDLTDAATLGCLLALVREAWGEPTLHVWYSSQLGLWVVSADGQEIGVQGVTEAEALVAALEEVGRKSIAALEAP